VVAVVGGSKVAVSGAGRLRPCGAFPVTADTRPAPTLRAPVDSRCAATSCRRGGRDPPSAACLPRLLSPYVALTALAHPSPPAGARAGGRRAPRVVRRAPRPLARRGDRAGGAPAAGDDAAARGHRRARAPGAREARRPLAHLQPRRRPARPRRLGGRGPRLGA